ncbi:delta-aminolevulinic acid dehydratase [Exiguobacterium sp. Leaf187]|uniref:Delta-aminolevulinic acid dehydratase n=3 Tax=Exiguobacterium TaxID=33986 RepID=A0A0V8GJH6_9BACL|nr:MULTISPECIES: porphobilinogen synthase [Exiguobacterium]AHA30357.1 delta-aminolevulinic acid dehydratase [Exiguobacterium sp. MH3]AOT01320.1 delta-aminolevulinic acid dehydratase [Exiguobacterium sp. U13-1]KQS19588.1 delta-aminolevulinic acid dehydratase [Exiguobacterium sp. Leaf187]KSU50400.1 delta-aminolevulinic acid dehydratase [Exiguobacterium enclense]MBF8152294.1 porphobilinogen synthase [Exiguobacterium sp. TBG-PICH-001]
MNTLEYARHRRLRHTASLRSLVRENQLHKSDLIYPIFVAEGEDIKREVSSMPGVFNLSLDHLTAEIEEVVALGIESVILFGVPHDHLKDEQGSGAFHDHGIVQEATRLVKKVAPQLTVIADTCLCEYTSTGHCGIVADGTVDNDASLPLHVKTAISQARAGADVIAPSSMMDGFVAAIRQGLDENGFSHIPVMSYGVKYASAYYGPFRDAANSAPGEGDRKGYQMDPANRREAFREATADVDQGADFMIVKPALAFMDIIRDVRERIDLPIVAYNVSGEYAMVKAAALNGWIDEERIVLETMLGFKRAGADLIITYFAKDICRYLEGSK